MSIRVYLALLYKTLGGDAYSDIEFRNTRNMEKLFSFKPQQVEELFKEEV